MMATTERRELRGWKSIAGYLSSAGDHVSVRAAMKYAADLGMPVRKLGDPNVRQVPVVAFADELDAWKRRVLRPRKSRAPN